jgi:hypothetical protein
MTPSPFLKLSKVHKIKTLLLETGTTNIKKHLENKKHLLKHKSVVLGEVVCLKINFLQCFENQ